MNFSTFLVDRDAVNNRGVVVRTSVGAAAEPTNNLRAAELWQLSWLACANWAFANAVCDARGDVLCMFFVLEVTLWN